MRPRSMYLASGMGNKRRQRPGDDVEDKKYRYRIGRSFTYILQYSQICEESRRCERAQRPERKERNLRGQTARGYEEEIMETI